MFTSLFDKLKHIELISDTVSEQWSYLTITGKFQPESLSLFKEINEEFKSLNFATALKLKIDNVPTLSDNFIDEIQLGEIWELHVNKTIIITQSKILHGFYLNLFLSQNALTNWIKNSNPVTEEHPFNKYESIKVIVNGLTESFGGSNFIITDSHLHSFGSNIMLPNESELLNYIHVVTKTKFHIKPNNHLITFGKLNEISKYFYRNAIVLLTACLCNEINDDNRIVLRGVRRIPLEFGQINEDEINEIFYDQLTSSIKWIYSEDNKCELKLKLLLERITLDINLSIPFINGLFPVLNDSLIQAQERYSFIIYERKDLYHNELRNLLKDIKSISELYSSKVRSLLSNLLRDLLATIILIGITLFSQASDVNKLFENKLISYAFFAFGIYFTLSAILQIIMDYIDTKRSINEFDYWQNISREYMTRDEFTSHKKKLLSDRTSDSTIMYMIIWVCYLLLAYICFNAPCLWNNLI